MSNSVKWSMGVAAVAAFALLMWWQSRPVDRPEAPETVASTPAPGTESVTPSATTEPASTQEAETAKPEAVAAEFDVVRVESDGQAVIAGRAGPGQTVEIVLDDKVLETVVTDAMGQFATALQLPQTGEAQKLTLRTKVDGAVVDSVEIAAKADSQAAAATGTGDDAARKAAADEATRAATQAQAEAERAAAEAKAAKQTATELAADAAAEAIARDIAEAEATTAGATPAVNQADLLAKSRAAEEEAARAAEEAEKRAAEAEAAAKEAAARKAEAEAATRAAADATATASATSETSAGSGEPVVARDLVSAPVIILPGNDSGTAPVLVRPDAEGVTLLQPAEAAPASQITLDRITYSDAGAVVAAGRGRAGAVVRVYGNAQFLKEVECGTDGQWEVQIAPEVAATTQLLRFDAIDAQGNVVSRLETPFEYSPQSVAQELKEREIVVQKGDYLWKFAEQYYGQGWRYSVIFSANSDLIRDPDLIYPGQVFKVPELVRSQ